MAAVKAKKTNTKLKAGQKKSVNKWLIVGGVAVVAVIGAVVVRFSGASSWRSVSYSGQRYQTLTTQGLLYQSMATQLGGGNTYRICFRGYSTGSSSTVNIQPTAFATTATVGSTSGLHCSKSVKLSGTYNTYFPALFKVNGPNVIVTAVSIDKLMY